MTGNKGFTLVELAIVIVIIGLLVTGVLTGQSLIESAKINRTISDIAKFNAAMNTFKAKYNAVPGDMRNAYSFFDGTGGSSICGANNSKVTVIAETDACNGNGNNLIGGLFNGQTDGSEINKMWVHLSLSNMLPGLVTYKPATGYYLLVAAPKELSNAPQGPWEGTIYDGVYGGRLTQTGSNAWVYQQGGFWLMLTGTPNSSTCVPTGTFWTPCRFSGAVSTNIGLAIDTKIDDGLPALGSVTAARAQWTATTINCTTPDSAGSYGVLTTPSDTIQYDLTRRGNGCIVLFKTNFD